jgi:predicted ATPase
MIERIQIQNYKALRDVAIPLTPLHVLIGPNDSGKTSVLEAVAALCRSTDHELPQAFLGAWNGCSLVWNCQAETPVCFAAMVNDDTGSFDYSLTVTFAQAQRSATVDRELLRLQGSREEIDFARRGHQRTAVFESGANPGNVADDKRPPALRVRNALQGIHFYRWMPKLLALPVAPDSKRRFRMEASGFGLALCLDDILGYDRDRFTALEQRFRGIFPQVRSIKLMAEPAYRAPVDDPEQVPQLSRSDGKGLYIEFDEGRLVAAAHVSEGMLLVLAYLTVLYLPRPPRVMLVEEPENGIHPKRLHDVLSILRNLVSEQAECQVILTTHSPYVVDLFRPEEVTLCQKTGDGSVRVRQLSESQAVREQLDVFTLGEIWTAEGEEGLVRAAADEASDAR